MQYMSLTFMCVCLYISQAHISSSQWWFTDFWMQQIYLKYSFKMPVLSFPHEDFGVQRLLVDNGQCTTLCVTRPKYDIPRLVHCDRPSKAIRM